MGRWDEVRRKARERHARYCPEDGDWTAESLLKAAEADTGVAREGVAAGDLLLYGAEAILDREDHVIRYNRDAGPAIIRYYQAHEYAHLWQHRHGSACICSTADIDVGAMEDNPPVGEQAVEGYSPQERREREANIFAREFLLPRDKLRRYFVEDDLDAKVIAERIGLPESLVFHQLASALLTVEHDALPREDDDGPFGLDPKQEKAARVPHGPFLLEAGPGTGKTRTLIARILFLLEQGIQPESILALTFSNRAAEEMRTRIANQAPEAAPRIWIGTFHAFGLEVLRKYGDTMGWTAPPTIIDLTDAVFLLEGELASLPLTHYQNLYEPTMYLDDILGAISRAKDELVGPKRYAELARQMRADAADSDEMVIAEKALEVAEVYTSYQQQMCQRHMLDYGDLIAQCITLLQMHEGVRQQIRQTYAHVLVDEYQDVNRASGILLKEIAGDGKGLWVVGDARQSIYRFRGAAPRNVTLFPDDFPGAQMCSLLYNYRSRPDIVALFAHFAPQMHSVQLSGFTPWRPTRAHTDGNVRVEIAEDGEAEGDGIAQAIGDYQASGIPYRNQAVLCRTHSQLQEIATRLELAGIPTLSLGEFLEREEVRDLLALISLSCEGNGVGLVRVARFLDYNVPLQDVLSLFAYAQEQEESFPSALGLAENVATISPEGRAGLALLDDHLNDLPYGGNAWSFLAHYLFNRSGYLRVLLQDESVAGQQKRLAILQLLQLAYRYRNSADAQGPNPKRAFLNYVRRLAAVGGDRQLRQLPETVAAIDAVRLLTVHGAKGLEFDVVYLPSLGAGRFPFARRGKRCPPPAGMLDLDEIVEHEAEEQCLFFVALSRAREVLCLSRALRYSEKQRKNPSGFFPLLTDRLPQPYDGPVTWPKRTAATDESLDSVEENGSIETVIYDANDLDTYLRCPREFHYEVELDLAARRPGSAYVQFHRCVYRTLHWLMDLAAQGEQVDNDAVLAYLEVQWQAIGPHDHPYEPFYRERAEAMLSLALAQTAGRSGRVEQPQWEIKLRNGSVSLTPDQVVQPVNAATGRTIRRLRTGRATQGEVDKNIYALYQVAARQAYPDGDYSLEVAYLSTGESAVFQMSDAKVQTRLNRYATALDGIRRREFHAQPDEGRCPRCAYFFICPAAVA